jgi:hypothetical protein
MEYGLQNILMQATCLDCKFIKKMALKWGDPQLTLADPTRSLSVIFPAAALLPPTSIKARMAAIEVNESQFPESQLETVSNEELSVIFPAAAMPPPTRIKAQMARIEVNESQFPESQLETVSNEELSVIFPAAAMPPSTGINITRPTLFSRALPARPAVARFNDSQSPVCPLDTVTHKEELTPICHEDTIRTPAKFQPFIASPQVPDDVLSNTSSEPELDNQPVKQLPTPVASQIITKRKCPAETDMGHNPEDITHKVSQLNKPLTLFVSISELTST